MLRKESLQLFPQKCQVVPDSSPPSLATQNSSPKCLGSVTMSPLVGPPQIAGDPPKMPFNPSGIIVPRTYIRWCYAHTNGEIWIMLMLFLLGNSEGNLWRSFRCRQQKSSSWTSPMFDLYIFFLVWSMVYIHLYYIYIYRTTCNCMTWYV